MCSPVTERNGPVALQGRSAGRRRPPWLAAGFPPSANSGSSRAAAALSAVVAAAGERLFCRGAPSASGRKAEAAHWAAVGSSFAGSAMPVASAQHKESAASTVSRYLLPKPPRHSPPLLPSPGPHHGFSPDPQACLQEIRQLASPGGASTAGGEASPFGRRSPASEPLLLEPPASMSAPAGAGYAAAPMVHRASPGGYDLRGHRRPPPPPGACSSLRFVALAQPGGAAVGRREIIVRSFKKTGISNALDGTEDDVVHENDEGDHAEAGDKSDDAAMSDEDGSLDSGSE
nr:arf-GAP with GTPase, ANK repeat and PH domain-containing protein 2-like [Rhipicephalus microplus]